MHACIYTQRTRLLPLPEVLARFPDIVRASDHVLAWWVPYTDTVQLLESNRTARGACPAKNEEEEAGSVASVVAPWLRPLRPLLGKLQVCMCVRWFVCGDGHSVCRMYI